MNAEHRPQPVLEPLSAEADGALSLRLWLLWGCAFFATWGAGLQQVAPFDLSKIFVGLAALLACWWLAFSRRRFRAFPRSFHYFLGFVLLHFAVTYFIVHPEEFSLSYLGESGIRGGSFVVREESVGIVMLRLLLLASCALAVAALIRNQRQLALLGLAYGAGLACSNALGSQRFVLESGATQYTGGFLNPNSLGPASFAGFWFALYALFTVRRAAWRLVALVCIGVALLSLAASVSRGSILAVCLGLITFIAYLPRFERKLSFCLLLLAAAGGAHFMLPEENVESLRKRVNPEPHTRDGGSVRLDIWSAYLHGLPPYVLTGAGEGRGALLIQGAYNINRNRVTHNTYLRVLAEYGALGLLLFLLYLRRLTAWFVRRERLQRTTADAVMAGMLTSWLVVFIFENTFNFRALWLSLGVLAAHQWLCTPAPPESGARSGAGEKQPQVTPSGDPNRLKEKEDAKVGQTNAEVEPLQGS